MFSALTGCQSLQFYQQAISGQARLLLTQQSTDELLQASSDPTLRERIELVNDILAFAEEKGLPSNGSYQSYVETGKPFIVWNVFASRPFDLSLKTHCFPVAGCVSYRGYFSRSDAEAYAERLEQQGYETYISGAAAYSTLGWFNDPLLDTFLFRREERLAALLFHELAHQLVYVPGDTRFSESVATAVERYLLKLWLVEINQPSKFEAYLASDKRRAEVVALIHQTRLELQTMYTSSLTREEMRIRKVASFEELVEGYEALRTTWDEGNEFHRWMAAGINNPKLETVADYNEWVPALLPLLEAEGIGGFRDRVQSLARMDSDARNDALKSLLEE